MANTGTEAYLLVVCVWEGTIYKEQVKYVVCCIVINVLEKEKARKEAMWEGNTPFVNRMVTWSHLTKSCKK